MKVGSLFSGGGLGDLGFLMAGCEIVFQVEIDEYCQKILELRYPDAKKFRDIREVKGSELPECDILTGGFPCQDVSLAGKRAGIKGNRSGLWKEYLRIICEIRPSYVVVENVPGLLYDGMGVVLGDLAQAGFDAEWMCIPACDVGAFHIRDRVWILAYHSCQGRTRLSFPKSPKGCWKKREEFASRLLESEGKLAVPAGKFGGVSDGVTNRMDRLKLLGNGQYPYCTKWIAERIIEYETETNNRHSLL